MEKQQYFKLTQYYNRLFRTSLVLYISVQMPRLIPVFHCLAQPSQIHSLWLDCQSHLNTVYNFVKRNLHDDETKHKE